MTPTRIRSFAPSTRASGAAAAALRNCLRSDCMVSLWLRPRLFQNALFLQPLYSLGLDAPGLTLVLLVTFRKRMRREKRVALIHVRIRLQAQLRNVVHEDLAASPAQRLHIDHAKHEP